MLGRKLLVIILVLCVSEKLSAEPDCSYEAQSRCGTLNEDEWKGKTWPQDAKELDNMCRSTGSNLECMIAFAERCPKSLFRVFLDYMRDSQKLYNRLCVNGFDDFRSQFLKNVPCLNNHVSGLFNECQPAFASKLKVVCEKNAVTLNCVAQGVSEKCGSEGRRIFDTLYKPVLTMGKIFCP